MEEGFAYQSNVNTLFSEEDLQGTALFSQAVGIPMYYPNCLSEDAG